MNTFNAANSHILGIPSYFFCAFVSFVLTACVYIVLISLKKYDLTQSMRILFISLCGMALGAKLFGFLTGLYRAIGEGRTITLHTLLDTGIVFYGGLFGLTIFYSLALKSKYCSLDKYILNVLAVCIPLFHSIARIGCFLSGCCYGKLHQGILSINYTTIINGNIDTHFRFPVQLFEATFEFGIFIYLFVLLRSKQWRTRKLLIQYFLIYSTGRFFLEFLRGDARRGLMYGISFSQCISILLCGSFIGYYIYLAQHKILNMKEENYNG